MPLRMSPLPRNVRSVWQWGLPAVVWTGHEAPHPQTRGKGVPKAQGTGQQAATAQMHGPARAGRVAGPQRALVRGLAGCQMPCECGVVVQKVQCRGA